MVASPNAQVVESLFAALMANDVTGANKLVTDDIAWLNTGLPAVRGRAVRQAFGAMVKMGIRFSATGYEFSDLGDDAVQLDRRDTLRWGPFGSTFFVSGRFDVRDGRVSRWDDRYRMGEVVGGFFRRG